MSSPRGTAIDNDATVKRQEQDRNEPLTETALVQTSVSITHTRNNESSTPQGTSAMGIGQNAEKNGESYKKQGGSRKLRKHRHADPNNPRKHTPVSGRGTKFRWEDNRHIDESDFMIGVKEKHKVSFKLRSTKGRSYAFHYPHRYSMDWNSKADLAKADKWRKQIFNRRLNKGDGESHMKDRRPHWSEREKESIKQLIRERIQKIGGKLNKVDWDKITLKHNRRFVGTTIFAGEKLPYSETSSGYFTKGSIVKVSHTLPARTWGAIYSQAQRWPDVKNMMHLELEEIYDKEDAEFEDADLVNTMNIEEPESSDEPATSDENANSSESYDSYEDETPEDQTQTGEASKVQSPQPMAQQGAKASNASNKEPFSKNMSQLVSVQMRTSMVTVQEYMNSTLPQKLWDGRDNRWRNFLEARKNFVKKQLQQEGLSTKQFIELDLVQKRYRVSQLERVFAAEFFQYSRDESWMQDAVGPTDAWLFIHGMSQWHVKYALQAIVSEGSHAITEIAFFSKAAASAQTSAVGN
ncbi:hypothetical protein G7Y89_g7690 [Cudoniella acicularis]|uniref:Uncharacterized protein n=1 Tax=Cudoniella acicularis TaxID=354080 RepID=A0A8H4W1B1_9HELO|nr:hypothetical protein G7Y89_g7690 [Cudoniella acicularis]